MRRFAQIVAAAAVVAGLLAPAYAALVPMAQHACCHKAAAHEHCGAAPRAGLNAVNPCVSPCCSVLNSQERPRALAASRTLSPALQPTQELAAESSISTPVERPRLGPAPRAPPQVPSV